MNGDIVFDPLLPLAVLAVLALFALAILALGFWRGIAGRWWRLASALALALALVNPSLQHEERQALSDIVVLVVDGSASQRLADRPAQTQQAIERVEARIAALPNTELRIVRVGDDPGDGGSLVLSALAAQMAELPRGRVAGVLLLTDGQVHDLQNAPQLPAPMHTLLTGQDSDWDRRLVLQNAPAFAILDEEVMLTLRVEDQGNAPKDNTFTQLAISIDGETPTIVQVPVGQEIELPLTLSHGGINVIRFEVPEAEGELTGRNNAAVVQINGIRDRLRVLLVSGEPHAGERTWRNLLKSDSSVDLVHFTILRPPEKQDGVPVSELSLIAFPTRELFLEKIDEFDLIIFDRYKRRGILPAIYLENVAEYVRSGGAVLVAAGPDFASADSIYRSPLAEILPGAPTARVVEQGFRPQVSELGQRHPVTEGLDADWPAEPGQLGPGWGRWMRLVDVAPERGQLVMTGIEDRPLLLLDRVDDGRVALLASDHAWLWSRGFEGGGPQLELLRRLAHWMMKEPELEEEALTTSAEGQRLTVLRRSLSEDPREVQITGPDGTVTVMPLEEQRPGLFTGVFEAPEDGLYRLSDGDLTAVAGLGPSAPREFVATVSTGDVLAPAVDATGGGIMRLADGMPDLRQVREGRVAAGRGWLGITPRNAYLTTDITLNALAPAWLMLLLAAGFAVMAWLREGRR
ncbi:membrane protein [Actibacterium mucosum KCTC 23349]|uniref:Membrane protein n=1 Tax=Actibacterium mucosum KCTC 23349 TaxID=1454373 RepID=A0A037ZII9_9RHOB|nr:membrane protein [Actibacterium mucosum]KAJ54655.1 membrane protein [Actibacterium mucosum KCTC 23349]